MWMSCHHLLWHMFTHTRVHLIVTQLWTLLQFKWEWSSRYADQSVFLCGPVELAFYCLCEKIFRSVKSFYQRRRTWEFDNFIMANPNQEVKYTQVSIEIMNIFQTISKIQLKIELSLSDLFNSMRTFECSWSTFSPVDFIRRARQHLSLIWIVDFPCRALSCHLKLLLPVTDISSPFSCQSALFSSHYLKIIFHRYVVCLTTLQSSR